MTKHLSIKIIGKVQGVLFRASAVDTAKALGLKGFVRNERDGSVYIEAEGDERDLNDFIEWCKEGPPAASVEHVEIKESELKRFKDFTIQRY